MTGLRRVEKEPDRPVYDDLKHRHGEDPARILNFGVEQARARIAGIDDLGLLAAYRKVEVAEFGSRPAVIAALDRRRDELKGGGRR